MKLTQKRKRKKKRPCIKKRIFVKQICQTHHISKNEIIGFPQQVPAGSQNIKKNSYNLSIFTSGL
jgi:hypothetical protein